MISQPDPGMIITFQVGEEEFVADGSRVLSVVKIDGAKIGSDSTTLELEIGLPTTLPMNAVIDLKDTLNLPRRKLSPHARFLVVESHNRLVAFLVDRVTSIGNAPAPQQSFPWTSSAERKGDADTGASGPEPKSIHVLDFDRVVQETFFRSSPPPTG